MLSLMILHLDVKQHISKEEIKVVMYTIAHDNQNLLVTLGVKIKRNVFGTMTIMKMTVSCRKGCRPTSVVFSQEVSGARSQWFSACGSTHVEEVLTPHVTVK